MYDNACDRIDYNKIYDSRNYGKFKILRRVENNKKSNHIMVEIMFIDTGTITTTRLCDVLVGNVRDRYRKTIHGVACIGNASSYDDGYKLWLGMINRCYNKNLNIYYRYGGKGVRVCDKWLCCEYFLQDLPYIDGYDNWVKNKSLYHIDKDIKQRHIPMNQRVYSLETCCFIQACDNVVEARLEKNLKNDKKYIGVRKVRNKFNAYISVNGCTHNIGTYETEELAAAAYNNAANYFYNNRIVLNDVPYIDPITLSKMSTVKHYLCTRV